ncbi:MAG: radical SAM protein [Putridiphycobacter sp.]|nr:radical SAM protein [Putridiphycobacter sp.]
MKADILLITPPFTQLNTPYPATAYLKGFLNTKEISSFQADMGLEVILKLFSKQGLTHLFDAVNDHNLSPNSKRLLALRRAYELTIEPVISFLQGHNPNLARDIVSEHYLPEGARFNVIQDLEWAFGAIGIQDKAKHLATLYLEDISDFIIANIDPHFGFSRYAERLSLAAHSFDDLYQAIEEDDSYITAIHHTILRDLLKAVEPKLVVVSIPFPGNLLMAFKSAQFIKSINPAVKIAFGGGYPNTELRSVSDKRVFKYVDFICLDDGEAPIEQLHHHVCKGAKLATLKRTFSIVQNEITYINNPAVKDYVQNKVGTPDYTDLKLNKYISVIEVINPMHSLWSDGRWNKLTLAHGCYWGKCTFCDISLDYIKNYEASAISTTCDRIEAIVKATGETGFHFVDEAAPPALMRDLALEIIRRDLQITWWTNIRFEKSFTADLCELLKMSGCIAVSGGIEVASDRLLALIDKGVDLQQLAQVTTNFTEAGIMVHGYLMYGFPTQTDLETINSLEVVRQFFELGIIQSGFWHQFAMTTHSPVGMNPEKFNVKPLLAQKGAFAHNDLPHVDQSGTNHQKYSEGLRVSLYNYMQGLGFEQNLQSWFNFDIKQPTIAPNFIEMCIANGKVFALKPSTKIIWTAALPQISHFKVTKKKKTFTKAKLIWHTKRNVCSIKELPEVAQGIMEVLKQITVENRDILTFVKVEALWLEKTGDRFENYMKNTNFEVLKNNGLLFI